MHVIWRIILISRHVKLQSYAFMQVLIYLLRMVVLKMLTRSSIRWWVSDDCLCTYFQYTNVCGNLCGTKSEKKYFAVWRLALRCDSEHYMILGTDGYFHCLTPIYTFTFIIRQKKTVNLYVCMYVQLCSQCCVKIDNVKESLRMLVLSIF